MLLAAVVLPCQVARAKEAMLPTTCVMGQQVFVHRYDRTATHVVRVAMPSNCSMCACAQIRATRMQNPIHTRRHRMRPSRIGTLGGSLFVELVKLGGGALLVAQAPSTLGGCALSDCKMSTLTLFFWPTLLLYHTCAAMISVGSSTRVRSPR